MIWYDSYLCEYWEYDNELSIEKCTPYYGRCTHPDNKGEQCHEREAIEQKCGVK